MPFNQMPMPPQAIYSQPSQPRDPGGLGGGAITPMPMPRTPPDGGMRRRAPLGPMPRPGTGGDYNPGNPPPYLPGPPFVGTGDGGYNPGNPPPYLPGPSFGQQGGQDEYLRALMQALGAMFAGRGNSGGM